MKKYMVTYTNTFNGSADYCDTITEAHEIANKYAQVGYIPDELYEYDHATKKYSKRVGTFQRITK